MSQTYRNIGLSLPSPKNQFLRIRVYLVMLVYTFCKRACWYSILTPPSPHPKKKLYIYIYIRNQARFYRIDIPTRRHKPYDPSFISESPKVFPLSMQNIKRFAMQCRDWVLLSSPVGFCPHGLSHNILVYNLCLYPRSRGNHSSNLNRQGLQADQRFSSKPTDHPSLIESRPKNLAKTQTIRLPFVCVCGAGIRGKRFPQKGCKEDCLLQTESIYL